MSDLTNPASRSPAQAEAYVRAILDVLGDADPVEVLGETPGKLSSIAEGRSPEVLSTPEAPGKWSARHVVLHLTDSDLVWAFRLRMVLAHDRPELAGYDQDAWADQLGYAERDLDLAVDTFQVVRAGNLELLERAGPEDMSRASLHEERGEEPLDHMIRLYAGHDLVHLRQIERILGAVGG